MSKGEIQYFITFAAGIVAFWLSGQAAGRTHYPHLGHAIIQALALAITLAVYGLGMAILAWLLYGRNRNLKAVGIATALAVILAAVGAQFLLRFVAKLVHTSQQVGYFTFVAFLLYGLFYVISIAVGKRFTHHQA